MKKIIFVFSVCALMIFSGLHFKNSDSIINAQSYNFKDTIVSEDEALLEIKNSRAISEKSLISFDEAVLHDTNTDKYYYPHDEFSFDVKRNTHYEVFDVDSHEFLVVAYDDKSYDEKTIIITETPMIHIKTIKQIRKPLKKEYDSVILTAISEDPSIETQQLNIKKSLRGASSIIYPKKSYSLNSESKIPFSLFGLDLNKKYVLNSMYEDEYKVRDVLSWDIWSDSSAYQNYRNIYNTSPMIYVEVMVDDSYEGLYGLQTPINEYTLELGSEKASIFKFLSWEYPDLDLLDYTKKTWGGVEVNYSNLQKGEKWLSFPDAIYEFDQNERDLDKIESLLDYDSFVEYYLFSELISARDNSWKNTFMSEIQDDEKLMITPWDLDITFGSHWTGEKPYLVESRPEVGMLYKPSSNGFFIHVLLNESDEFNERAVKRYHELRNTDWQLETLIEKSETHRNYLNDTNAYQRDLERWPTSPKIIENEELFIDEYLMKKVNLLDSHFNYTGEAYE